MKKLIFAALSGVVVLLSGCASNPMLGTGVAQSSAQGYTTQGALQAQSVYLGTVIALRPVVIAQSNTGLGGALGAIAGGALGSRVGNGRGQQIATVIGALAGAYGGQAAQGAAQQQAGVVVTVKCDNGNVVAVTQTADQPLAIGERVQLIQGGGWPPVSRVLPI
jgi:outer membrane lipoprotein SlyB